MALRNVVITRLSKVSSKMNQLLVQTQEDTFQIPLADIGVLLIASIRCVVTGYAIQECVRRGIRIVFCDDKGIPIGELNSYIGNQNRNENIRTQFQWEQSRKDSLWKQIVKLKILHQALTLKLFEKSDWKRISDMGGEVAEGDPNNREAVAAHMYFPRLYGYEFVRSDDMNPLNGLLNYGYAVLLSEVSRQICSNGYLTELGIHHDNFNNPFNLSCDFMEPFRPYIDKCVFEMKHPEMDPENKAELVKVLQSAAPNENSTVEKQIQRFVRESLRYLQAGDPLPSLEF